MIILIPSTIDHVDDIYEIEQSSFSQPWSKRSIRELISEKHAICLSAISECGKIIGCASMMHVINEGHVYNIAVAQAYKRQSVGSFLLEGLISKAVEKEMIGLTLEVRAGNNAAISMYKKFGFNEEGVRKGYYHHPTEDGIIMWKYLEPELLSNEEA